MFELDFRNVIVLVSLAIHASLLWILYRYARKTHSGKAYSVAILAIAGWIFPMALYRAHLFGEVLLWARLLYVMASFTSTTFLFFTFIFPDNKKPKLWVQILLVLENLFIVYLCLHPTWMITGVELMDVGEDKILWGPLYPIYSSHISLLFLAGFVVLFKKWRKAKGLTRQQILYILVGYFLGANLAMTTNLIMPWLGYFELNWIGQFFSTLVAVFTTYAILKHQLLDVKLIVAEGLLLILNLFVVFQIFLSTTTQQLIRNLIFWIAVLIMSFLLMKSVKKEIQRREEITKLADSLETANLKLKELDQQKTDFLSIASHQLRTPLSILKGYIELMKDGAYGQPTKGIVKILGEMDESNERLVKLIDEFLDITRIEQGRTKFDFTPCSVDEIINSVIKEISERAEKKGILLKGAGQSTVPRLNADGEKIRHVIFNFVDNAIKYSEKGTITISLKAEHKGLAIRVKDEGIGFDKVDEANFFQKFYRGANVKDVDVNGTGLGLYVCRKFIEAHQGRIWAKSEGLGKGSEFGFWVPFAFSKSK